MAKKKSGVVMTVDHLERVAAGIAFMASTRVMVGIPASKTTRSDKAPSNAQLLYLHENGAPEVALPARPTLMPGVKQATPEIERRMRKAGEAALDGRPQAAQAQYEACGFAATSAVKQRINSNTPPPLSERTLAARRKRGVKRTNTLVDTGQMRNAVTHVLRKV